MELEEVVKNELKKIGTSLECVNRKVLNKLGMKRSLRSSVGIRWLGAAVSCQY